ncbi:MAG: alpha-amylase family glycosyl hydrolase [Soonwooa sp.]
MGVKSIWFMPITPIAKKNKKGNLGSPYAAQDYTSINPEFGTLQDFKDVVNKAHELGLNVIIDWVANHTGWDHVWTKLNPDFYLKDPDGNFHIVEGMDDIIELDFKNPNMRQAMIDAMKYWVREANIDGFRCDLASWVEVEFWQQTRPEVEKLKALFWLGEFDELDTPEYGKVFDASYSWKWMHLTKDYYQNKLPLQHLRNLLQQYSNIGDNSMRAWFTTNHDENTWNGTEYEKYGELAPALAVFSATWNGVPLLYNGQELPLKTKRLAFFEKDTIPWAEQNALQDFYKTLLNLKSENPALRGGDYMVTTYWIETSANDKILAYLRKNADREVLVLINMTAENVAFNIKGKDVEGLYKNVFTQSPQALIEGSRFTLKAYDYLVFEK